MFSKRAFNARRKRAKQAAKPRARKKKAGPTTDTFVNSCVIPWQKTCDFCEDRRAVFHCPSCDNDGDGQGDFLCDQCDNEVHRHVKRSGHVRTQLRAHRVENSWGRRGVAAAPWGRGGVVGSRRRRGVECWRWDSAAMPRQHH